MLLFDKGYKDAIVRAAEEAETIDVAVAFWGIGGESVFESWTGKRLRIVCNLALGGTNPKVVRELRGLPNAEIRQLDNLHAKLVLTDRTLITGSANISSNGLGLEGSEQAAWREVGMLSVNSDERSAAKRWFASQWKSARSINDDDLLKAEAAWKSRRKDRPKLSPGGKANLLDQPISFWADRLIYLAVYRNGLSDTAEFELEREQTKISHAKLDLYEGWDEGTLPDDPTAVIIPVYWGAKGKVEVSRAQRPIPQLNGILAAKDGGQRLNFTGYVMDASTLDFVFDLEARKQLASALSPWLNETIELNGGGVCHNVYEFLLWKQERSEKMSA